MWWLIGLVVGGSLFVCGFYQLFVKDVMNRIQYIEYLRLYWITRDLGEPGVPFMSKATMRQTDAPYWRGNGVQFRVGKLTFQVGVLRVRVDSLEAQLGSGWLDYVDAPVIRRQYQR